MMRSTGATNLIFKGKTIPLVLEKSKSGSIPIASTAVTTPNPSENPVSQSSSPSKVPNILRGTSSPSKNTIDRQIVSHEATIELRKNNLGILSSNKPNLITTTTNNGSNIVTTHSTSASVSKENLSSVNGTLKPSEIPASVVVPKSVLLEPKIPDSRIPDLL